MNEMTTRQAAERSSVCEDTIRREIRRGHLRARWLGNRYRIAEDDYLTWCERGLVGPTSFRERLRAIDGGKA